MVQDITDCLVWARENDKKFNFDKVSDFIYNTQNITCKHQSYPSEKRFLRQFCVRLKNILSLFVVIVGTNDGKI